MDNHRLPEDWGRAVAGREIDAWCTRCKLELAHTIVAVVDGKPARVTCRSCGSDHVFRDPPAASSAPARAPRERTKAPSSRPSLGGLGSAPTQEVHILWRRRMEGRDEAQASAYSSRGSLRKDTLVRHVSFGVGIVDEILPDGKARILFSTGPRLLVCGR